MATTTTTCTPLVMNNYNHGLCSSTLRYHNDNDHTNKHTIETRWTMNDKDVSISPIPLHDHRHHPGADLFEDTAELQPPPARNIFTRSVPNLSAHPPAPPPPPPPLLPSIASSSSSSSSNQSVNLKSMLDIFESALSQRQAWALLYQSLKSLKTLLATNTQTRHALRELDSFEQFSLDASGNVTSGTWMEDENRVSMRRHSVGSSSTSSLSQASFRFADDEDDDDEETRVRLKLTTANQRKSPTMNESCINSILASLAKLIYSALSQTFAEDEEPDLDEELEELLGYMLKLGRVDGAARGGSITFRKLNNIDDEGYIDVDEDEGVLVHAMRLVLDKCNEHFYLELAKLENQPANRKVLDVCPILEMLVQQAKHNDAAVNIEPDLYFQTVCRLMVEETYKLYRLLDQLCDVRNNDSSTQFGQPSASFSSASLRSRTQAVEIVDLENLKLWAYGWIKVMSELRFGVHLRPVSPELITRRSPDRVNVLQAQIQSLRGNLRKVSDQIDQASLRHETGVSIYRRHISLPSITEKMIVDRLQSLRPAMERSLSQLPPPKPCLHDCLMNEIRASTIQLRPTTTIVKPNLKQLYLGEQSRRRHRSITSTSRARPHSQISLNASNSKASPFSIFSPLRKKSKVSSDASSSPTLEKLPGVRESGGNFLRRFRSSMTMSKSSSKKRLPIVDDHNAESTDSSESLHNKSYRDKNASLGGSTTGPLSPRELYRPLVYLDRYSSISSHALWNEHRSTTSKSSTALHYRSPVSETRTTMVSPGPLMSTQSTLNIVRPVATVNPTTVFSKRISLPPVQSCSCITSPTARRSVKPSLPDPLPKNSYGFFRRSFMAPKRYQTKTQPSAYLDLNSSTHPPSFGRTTPTKSFLGSIYSKFFNNNSSATKSCNSKFKED